MTTDQLLKRTAYLIAVKQSGFIAGQTLTQAGLDRINAELCAIDAELDQQKPEGEFITVYAQVYNSESGECWECGRDTLWGDAPHKAGCQAREGEVAGFERIA